jgi:hypothetical protein
MIRDPFIEQGLSCPTILQYFHAVLIWCEGPFYKGITFYGTSLCFFDVGFTVNKEVDLKGPRVFFDNCWFYCTAKGTPVGFTSLLQSFLQI